MDESIIKSFGKGLLKKPVLDSRLFVKYKEPGKKERSIIVNVEVQKRLGVGLMSRLALYLSALLRDQIIRGGSSSLLRKVYTVTLVCQNMVRFRGKPEQYLHFTCGDELLERAHKLKNMVQHVFLEVNKFNKDTDGVNRTGCLFEAFMYIAKRWSVLTEEMLEEIILAGGYMAEVAFKLSQLNTTLTEEDFWLAVERQKEQEELALAEAEKKGKRKGMKKGVQKGMQKGKQEGMQKGEQRAIETVARRMLSKGLDVKIISLSTGLTSEEVTKLADSMAQ